MVNLEEALNDFYVQMGSNDKLSLVNVTDLMKNSFLERGFDFDEH